MGRRVLRSHVDHDALVDVVAEVADEGVPVLPRDGEDAALGGLARVGLRGVVGRRARPGGSVERCLRRSWSSVVRPPAVRRRDLGALVLHRDPAERVVLALRVPGPVVGHLDAGQRRVAVEDDAEEVPRLALVPVQRRVHGGARRDVGVGVGRGDLEAHPTVVVIDSSG